MEQRGNPIEHSADFGDLDPTTLTYNLQQHSAFKRIDSPEKLRLFGQYHIFVIWNYWQVWQRLLYCLRELKDSSGYKLSGTPLNEQLAHYIEVAQVCLSGNEVANFETLAPQLVERDYRLWREAGISFAALQMLKDWLRRSKKSVPPLTPLNFAWHLTEFVRYTLESNLDLLPHELAVNLYISYESMVWSRKIVLDSYNACNAPQFVWENALPLPDTGTVWTLLEALCSEDSDAWQEIKVAAQRALQAHLKLWDGVEKELKYHEVFKGGPHASSSE